MPNAYRIVPARWPQDTETARTLLGNYRQFLADSPLGAAGICLAGYDAEMKDLPGRFASDEADLLLGWVENEVGGCAAIGAKLLPDGTHAAEMKRLWVEPRFRGLGLGRGLIGSAVEWARAHGCTAVVLDTVEEAMPEARALYLSIGFEEIEPLQRQ